MTISKPARSTDIVEYDGTSAKLSVHAKAVAVSTATLLRRLDRGWSLADALALPVGSRTARPNHIIVAGEKLSGAEASRRLGVSVQTLRRRIAAGMTAEQAAAMPVKKYVSKPKAAA